MIPTTHPVWTPSMGAWVGPEGATCRVWAPASSRVDVIVERSDGPSIYALDRSPDGTFSAVMRDVRAGDRYRYRLDNDRLLPDPASRFQPEGVHGPSQVVDPRLFRWNDGRWAGLDLDGLVFYELHVGTFSPEGTFAGVTARLPALAALGITAVELMPVADFPGSRNWGYDGVALFAPARCYGTPDDLRRLVDTAHGLGLAVFLDVVYNHLGPDGAYLSAFSPYYFTEQHHTPWGARLNFDGDRSRMVREFFIENARHWVHEYHIDGLRLDATHAITDDSPRHFLAELASRVRESATGRRVLVVAEDHRNLNWMLKPERDGGWGVDAAWADDFHHQCRRLLAGDSEGYYRDCSGRTDDVATTIRQGWFYTGQLSTNLGEPRGTDPTGIPANRFVICLQNHDQIGNRALGERLHGQIDQRRTERRRSCCSWLPKRRCCSWDRNGRPAHRSFISPTITTSSAGWSPKGGVKSSGTSLRSQIRSPEHGFRIRKRGPPFSQAGCHGKNASWNHTPRRSSCIKRFSPCVGASQPFAARRPFAWPRSTTPPLLSGGMDQTTRSLWSCA